MIAVPVSSTEHTYLSHTHKQLPGFCFFYKVGWRMSFSSLLFQNVELP